MKTKPLPLTHFCIEPAILHNIHMSTDKLLKNIFLFKERIAYNLEIFDRNFCIFTIFENVSIIMLSLFLEIKILQAMLHCLLFSWLHEALNSKEGKVRNNCLIDQIYVAD